MTDSKRIFLDTSPIIYYLQHTELYYLNMKLFWKKYEDFDYITLAVCDRISNLSISPE
jgi:hypothetical protein